MVSVPATQCSMRFVHSLSEHGRYRQAEPEQESPKPQRITNKYNIGDRANQQITKEKARNDDRAVLLRLSVYNTFAKPVHPTGEEVEVHPGNDSTRGEADCGGDSELVSNGDNETKAKTIRPLRCGRMAPAKKRSDADSARVPEPRRPRSLLILRGCHGHADHLHESHDRAKDQPTRYSHVV